MKKHSYFGILLVLASTLVSCGTPSGWTATAGSRNTATTTMTSSPTISPTKLQTVKMILNFENPATPFSLKEETLEILKKRFDNCSFPTTITLENNQIVVLAPESFKNDFAISELLFQRGELELRDSENHVILTNSNIQSCQIISMEQVQFALNLSLDEVGTMQLTAATNNKIGTHLSILIDGVLYSNLVIEEAVTTGSFSIPSLYEEEALYLNTILSFEPLPAKIYEVSSEIYDN